MRPSARRLPRIRTRVHSEPRRSYPLQERRLGVSERQRTGKPRSSLGPMGVGPGINQEARKGPGLQFSETQP